MGTFGESLFNDALFNGSGSSANGTLAAGDILYSAYRIAGILKGPQRGLSPEEITEGLDCLNTVIDSYNSQRYMILSIGRKLFTLNANQQEYEIGPTAADWVTARPPKIEDASLISLENPQQPLEIPLAILTMDQWQLIPTKNTTSTYPQGLWYNPAQEYLPNARILFWPTPSISNQVAIYGWSQIALAVDATTQLSLAPGYKASLQYDLAIELCPRWRFQVPPDVRLAAIEYKKNIKSVNLPTLDLYCDEALLGRTGFWNWRTGSASIRGGN